MSCENCVHFVVCEAFEKGVGIKKIHPMICAEFLDVVRIGNPVPLGIITRPGAGGGMRLILGAELKRVRENISCPQLGDDHYGSWGALRLEQRLTIARMIKTIEILDETLERVTRPPQVDVTSSERTVQTMRDRLVELIKNAKAAMKAKNLSCDIARNMFVADFMMANDVTVQEWISVKDGLPEEQVRVLGLLHTVFESGGHYDLILVMELINGLFIPFNCSPIRDDSVTHWMPLPQPPKGRD